MAINKLMMSALRLLSYKEGEWDYKIDRKIKDIIMRPVKKLPYNIWDRVIPAQDGYNIPVRVFLPEDQRSTDVLLFFHGGGWVSGNIDNYTTTCMTLSEQTGRRVLSVDYRLAPEFPFPYAPNDCYTVTREFFRRADEIGINRDNLVLIGDSAGGNLAAVVSLMAAERKEFQVRRQILIYPSTYNDHTLQSKFKSVAENGCDYLLTSKRLCDYVSYYLRTQEDYHHPYFAPLLAEDLSGQPRTLIITAEFDPLRDEGEEYAKRLAEAGSSVVCERMSDALHGFFVLPKSYEPVKRTYKLINEFLEEDEDAGDTLGA